MAKRNATEPDRRPAGRPVYATVVMMNGARWYSRFGSDLPELIAYAERMPGVVAVELAHAGKPPVWERSL